MDVAIGTTWILIVDIKRNQLYTIAPPPVNIFLNILTLISGMIRSGPEFNWNSEPIHYKKGRHRQTQLFLSNNKCLVDGSTRSQFTG